MSSGKMLQARWQESPGKEIARRIVGLGLINLAHGRHADEVFRLLTDLPHRHEVSNGRDLRGLRISARELDLSQCDFSYSQVSYFFHCKLDGSIFDRCKAERASFHSSLISCSFASSRLRSCYFNDSIAHKCSFSDARLKGCSFQNADLSGSQFSNSDCRGATFAGANLIGCNFNGAVLDLAVFCDVVLDKTTDFRGAEISNVIVTDWLDSKGNIVRKGADLSKATL